jgi:phosphomannomutase
MTKIKFGTDGWRAIIAEDYTADNVRRVAEGTALWMEQRGMKQVVIGYDCRFGGKMFAEASARVFGSYRIKVLLADKFCSTPMVSLGVVKTKSDMGVVITASHNPAAYNGYKLKSAYGGPTIPDDIAAVEALVPAKPLQRLPDLATMRLDGLLEDIDLEEMYFAHVVSSFDLEAIKASGLKIAYDAMYGAGQDILPRILPDATLLHCDFNPSFLGQAPEPILRNLAELSELMKSRDDLALGLANDGDADRIGLFDTDGNFVDSHHILLLLLSYLHKTKGMDGKVVITFSVTDKMKQMAEKYGLECEVTKIGFKYIAEIMTKEDVLVGGEESGGLAVKGHIPERDGIWIGLVILEFMAKTGKSLKDLINEVYAEVGAFVCDRDDLHITEAQKESVITGCKENLWKNFGEYQVLDTESIDGYKFILPEHAWVMIRPSGTEPVLRVYVQASDASAARQILDTVRDTILT